MELLNRLEERVMGLLHDLETMRAANKALMAEVASEKSARITAEEEIQTLKEALAEEKQTGESVLQRVDAVLRLLDDIEKSESSV